MGRLRGALGPWLGLAALLCLAHAARAAFQLTILHTNDVHARVEQTSRDSGKCQTRSGGGPPDCYGGVARRYTKIREIRATHPNVLLLDAGDQYQGTVWFSYFKGREAARFMNFLGYDAMALGNHEFDNGLDGLLDPLLKNVNFSILSANIQASKSVASRITGYFQPYKILQVGSEKIGVVGYTTKETSFLSNPGPPPSSEMPAGNYPFLVKSDDGRQVPVVQAYAFGKYLGYLNVTFDDQGKVINTSGNPILLNSSIPEDRVLREEVDKWKIQLNNFSSHVIGKTIVYLNGTSQACRFQECNMGNLICDAMIYNNLKHRDENTWNHVSMCIMNGGGIRSPIDERNNNGTITMEDLLAVLPFGGTFDLMELKGSTLKEAFEHSVRRHGQGTGELLQVGGIHVVYDLSRPPGSRVVSTEVLCTACRVPAYVPLQMDETYKVILPSFLQQGGDGYSMLKNKSLSHNQGDLDVEVVSNYISRMGRVFPAVEGRVKFSAGNFIQGSITLIAGLFTVTFLHFIF
ncbi:5'-nucleotidase isoform X2 [Caretta caretta]|uniref:5'-nucleotidase isoform X2 n=1 Tax=Caretta caretta TaxID=8467 RepID=UPI002094AD90|nr:5'-nucleotidase isoform X3 [Caretta caretta]